MSSINDIPYGTILYWSVYFSDLSHSINFFFLLFAIPIGVLSNVLAFFIYSRKRLNKCNVGFFNRCISVANAWTLLFILLMNSSLFFPFDFNTDSNWICAFTMFARKSLRQLSPMIEVLYTFDRFLCVIFPGKFQFLNKNSNIFGLIVIIFVFLMLTSLENVFYYVEVNNSSYISVDNVTKYWISKSCTAAEAITLTSDQLVSAVRCFIPLITTSILGFLMVRRLNESSKIRSSSHQCEKTSREHHFAMTRVFINIMFAVCNVPVAVMYIVKDAYYYTNKHDMTYIWIEFVW